MSYCARKLLRSPRAQRGVTLVELLVTASISAMIVGGLSSVIRTSVESKAALQQQNELSREASFAMDRIIRVVSHSRRLLLPLADNPATAWRDHVREQTVPPSPPEAGSLWATATLAVTLPLYSDLDFNGIPDADNDGDGQIDEDTGGDQHNDFGVGIYQIDDNGDGLVDNSFSDTDDDESFAGWDEDPINGIDDDGDGSADEDSAADANGDGCPGVCGVDDDGDGVVDEGASADDDEDGAVDEDWFDAVVFYLDGGTVQRAIPVPWDETGAGGITGRDFLVSDLATG